MQVVCTKFLSKVIVLLQATLQACGTTGLSCVLYNNIYQKVVNRATAVHPMATGIGTTSQTASRDWLMSNILRGTDEFTLEVATNMTSLVRSNFAIDDRVQKAWFINPGNRWNVPLTGGAQSSLLLTDKLIMFAVITLNDGTGNILRRRLLSFSPSASSPSEYMVHNDRELDGDDYDMLQGKASRSLLSAAAPSVVSVPISTASLLEVPSTSRSLLTFPAIQSDESLIENALEKIQQTPRVGTFPPLDYGVDIPLTVATIFGVETRQYALLTIDMEGKVMPPNEIAASDAEYSGNEFFRRLAENKDKFCTSCEQIYPVFNNIKPLALDGISGRRRALLQQQSTDVSGTFTILLVFDSKLFGKPISFANLSMAVYNTSFTPVWAGSTEQTKITDFVGKLEKNQFVVRRVNVTGPEQ